MKGWRGRKKKKALVFRAQLVAADMYVCPLGKTSALAWSSVPPLTLGSKCREELRRGVFLASSVHPSLSTENTFLRLLRLSTRNNGRAVIVV